MKKLKVIFLYLLNICAISKGAANIIFVPRQLSYNPIFENALVCSSKVYDQDRFSHFHKSDKFIISAKPIYTQNVGSKCSKYFTIDNESVLHVQENGTGDISSIWFQVVTPTNFYSSELFFNPKRTTFGAMLYAWVNFAEHFAFSANTALIHARNTMNISETNISLLGQASGLQTMQQAFSNSQYMKYGLINGTQSQSGLDDIQVKFIYHSCDTDENIKLQYEAYILAGIPTGAGSQAQYLFEPLVGSNHAQIGLGGNLHYTIGKVKFQAEAKWRYAFTADEMRSFDLAKNGQWSRYLLVVNSLNKYVYSPAINDVTFITHVTPQNSFDLYCAAYFDHEAWHVEAGYDFWIRQAEKICVSPVFPAPSIGIADLYNISRAANPQSASSANISQGVILGQNNAVSDAAFIAIQGTDFNLASAAAPQSLSNSIYGTIAYTKELMHHVVRTGFSLAYECGHGINVPNNISVFINLDISF